MTKLEKISERPLLSTIAYERIKSLILTGIMKRGSPLVIDDLASQLGTSRTPVREAILLLARDGLAVSVPNRGTYVTGIDKREVLEIYEIRTALEPLAVRLATPLINQDDLRQYFEAIEEIRSNIQDESSRIKYTEVDVDFHKIAFDQCGNEMLQKVLSQLFERIFGIHIYTRGLPPDHIKVSIDEHSAVIEAILSRDADMAAKLMRDHVSAAMERIAQYLDPNGGEHMQGTKNRVS